jgi:hypothetical protein
MKAIRFTVGEYSYSFFIEANAGKTLAEFCEHEKHYTEAPYNLTKDHLKEVYGLIKKEGKKSEKVSKPESEKPVG